MGGILDVFSLFQSAFPAEKTRCVSRGRFIQSFPIRMRASLLGIAYLIEEVC